MQSQTYSHCHAREDANRANGLTLNFGASEGRTPVLRCEFLFGVGARSSLLHEPAAIALRCSTDREPVDLDSRNPHPDWHRLPIFSASTNPLVELEIISDHRYTSERIRTVANQRRALNRSGDTSVLDQVSLRRGENKLPIRDVHLPATEIHRINSALDRSQNVLGIILACQHVSVRHARHGDVLVALTPPVAGIGNAHQLRRKFVAEIIL